MRPIDADQLLDFIKFDERVIAPEEHTAQDIVMMIQTAPTITPPPNAPLTLEQLREMDGEPVWNDTMKQWAIVDTHDRRTINVCGRWRPLSDRYYRRKPEEGMM